MDEKFLLAKLEAVVMSESSKSDFDEEDIGRVRAEAEKAVRERRIRRFEDLRNFVHSGFDAIAREKGLQLY